MFYIGLAAIGAAVIILATGTRRGLLILVGCAVFSIVAAVLVLVIERMVS